MGLVLVPQAMVRPLSQPVCTTNRTRRARKTSSFARLEAVELDLANADSLSLTVLRTHRDTTSRIRSLLVLRRVRLPSLLSLLSRSPSSMRRVMIYALFATSKDVTIGPVAVMSLEVARVISHVQSSSGGAMYSAPEIATALAFLCGLIVLGIGMLRIGWLIEVRPEQERTTSCRTEEKCGLGSSSPRPPSAPS